MDGLKPVLRFHEHRIEHDLRQPRCSLPGSSSDHRLPDTRFREAVLSRTLSLRPHKQPAVDLRFLWSGARFGRRALAKGALCAERRAPEATAVARARRPKRPPLHGTRYETIAARMIVHLIDGTYELFRHFYGIRRFRGSDPPYGAVTGLLGTVLQMIEQGATHI